MDAEAKVAVSYGYASVKLTLCTRDCFTLKYDGPPPTAMTIFCPLGTNHRACRCTAVSVRFTDAVPLMGRFALKKNGCGIAPVMLALLDQLTAVTLTPRARPRQTRTAPPTSKPGWSFVGYSVEIVACSTYLSKVKDSLKALEPVW